MKNHIRYKVSVLGAGPRGKGHLLAFLSNANRFDVVGVCDQNSARLERMLKEINATSLPQYTDVEAMLERTKPDVFCFATQPNIRLELAQAGIRNGVKAIAYEKPMATSLAEARMICDACDKAGVKHIVCHQHKYGAHWRKVKEIVDSGRIGEIRFIHATAKGWFFFYITHLVDYAMWLQNYPEIRWLTGIAHGRGMLTHTHPSPDYVLGQVGFANNARALFECGPLAPCRGAPEKFWYNAGITVQGTEGFAEVIVGKGWRAVTRDTGFQADPGISLDEIGDTAPYITDLATWLDDDKAEHPCNGRLAYRGFELSMGFLLSSLDSRIIIPPVDVSAPITERMLQEIKDECHIKELKQ